MIYDRSYGIVPLRRINDEWEILLVQHNAGHWAFPKGHADAGESHQEAAARELQEETGLTVEAFLSKETLTEQYMFKWKGDLIKKEVIYFIALVQGTIALQEKEIMSCQWLPLKNAEEKMSFKEGKNLCRQVQKILSQ
jgi:bis(5'-nucleosidyl)-tetraphosphatase